jgi:aspartyl/asparaginyl-tRNA synthetase
MAIVGDLKRVFEIGPVFRAEKSMTRFVPAFPMHSVWFYI